MLCLLESAHESNGVLSFQHEPGRYAAVLLQCFSRDLKAREFLTQFKANNPNLSSVMEVKLAFLERFQSEGMTSEDQPPSVRKNGHKFTAQANFNLCRSHTHA
jgi:hypothetical protein